MENYSAPKVPVAPVVPVAPMVPVGHVDTSLAGPHEACPTDAVAEAFGFIGGTLLGVQLFPQIHKAFATKKTEDLSYLFIGISMLGSAITIVYGVLIWSYAIMVTITVSFVSKVVLVGLKLKYESKREEAE